MIIKLDLKKSQKEGVSWLINEQNAGLCYSTGIGKTLTAIVAAMVLYKRGLIDSVIVFHLKSAKKAFTDDLKQHTNLKYNHVYETGQILPAPIVNLVQFNQARILQDLIANRCLWNNVVAILDEIQAVKTPNKPTRLAFDRFRPSFRYTWGFTATPVGNRLDDLYHMTDYIRPGFFGTYYQFRDRYCELRKRVIRIKGGRKRVIFEIIGYKNLEELHVRVQQVWLVRSETMEKRFKFINLGCLPENDERKYNEAAQGIVEGSSDLREFVNRLHPLQRVVDLSDLKMNRVVEGLKKFKARGKGCLVFFVIKDSLYELERRLPFKVEIITGETSSLERGRIKDEFVKDRFILCTPAGARSFNFHQVNTVLFYTVPFEVELFAQMIGRVARPFVSEYEHVDIIIPYVDRTIDTYRIELMKLNTDLVKSVFPEGSPNLMENVLAKRRELLIALRKDLLWRLNSNKRER